MAAFDLPRRLAAEALGTGLLVCTVVGSGIMAERLAHLMFEVPLVQLSQTVRSGTGQWIAESVATFGLVAAILLPLYKGRSERFQSPRLLSA